MNDQLEREITDTLARAADELAHAPAASITESAIRRGKALRRRRRVAAAAGAFGGVALAVPLVYVALGVGGSTPVQITPGGPPSKPATSDAPTTSPGATTEAPEIATTPCSQVQPPPPDTAVDTTLFKEEGLLQINYSDPAGKNHAYTIDYRDDPTCAKVPRLQQIIKHAIESSEY